MGERPIFTCQAHVFTINPTTRRSWIQASSKAIDINIYYDSTNQCYRIVSVEDGSTGVKVVINSTITSKMVFKQTSQKFGQWADPKSLGVFGLGFDSEFDLNKFVAQFRQCVEAMKQINGESTGQMPAKQIGSQPSTLKTDQPIAPVLLPVSTPPNPPLLNTFNSANDPIPVTPIGTRTSGEPDPLSGEGQQLLYHQYYQDNIQRLECELEALRRQAVKHFDSASPNFPLKTKSDGTDLRDGTEQIHIASSDNRSGGSGAIMGAKESLSFPNKESPSFLGGVSIAGDPIMEKDTSSGQVMQGKGSIIPEKVLMLLEFHGRLGRILQEACDLHKQISHLLAAVTSQTP